MSTYTDASLIITPNAKKAGKLYSLKGADLDAVRATTATYVGSDGLNKTALANEVRFDYTNGSCPSILVEPQRTNLLLRSDEFSNIIWSKINTTVTEDSTISPDGTTNADTFTLVSSTSRFIQSLTLGAGSYTVSVYLKITSGTPNLRFQINIDGTSTDFSITGLSSVWQRYTATFTATTSVTNFAIRGLGSVGQVAVWGAQLEAGSNATSYIPTVASSVTRNADVISKSGISSLIGQAEGTLFVDCNINTIEELNRRVLSISDGTTTNRINIGFVGTILSLTLLARNSGGFIVNTSNLVDYGSIKICFKYSSIGYKLFVNGSLFNDSSFGLIPNLNVLEIGSFRNADFLNDRIKSVVLWKTALTDQQCISITQL